MFCCRLESPSYELKGPLKEMSAEDYDKFRRAVTSLELPESQADLDKWYVHGETIVDSEELEIISNVAPVRIRKVKGLGTYIHNRVGEVETKYQISVPNVGLLAVDTVEVLENCCTHELQQWLNRGWRILAICPPNDARRPDYVVGRTGKDDS